MISGALRVSYIGNYLSIYGCGLYLISTLSSFAPYSAHAIKFFHMSGNVLIYGSGPPLEQYKIKIELYSLCSGQLTEVEVQARVVRMLYTIIKLKRLQDIASESLYTESGAAAESHTDINNSHCASYAHRQNKSEPVFISPDKHGVVSSHCYVKLMGMIGGMKAMVRMIIPWLFLDRSYLVKILLE